MAEQNCTPGGLAVDSSGQLERMPHDTAHGINNDLYNLLVLLRSAGKEVESIGEERDVDPTGLTDASSRAISLLSMGREKVVAMLRALAPYV